MPPGTAIREPRIRTLNDTISATAREQNARSPQIVTIHDTLQHLKIYDKGRHNMQNDCRFAIFPGGAPFQSPQYGAGQPSNDILRDPCLVSLATNHK